MKRLIFGILIVYSGTIISQNEAQFDYEYIRKNFKEAINFAGRDPRIHEHIQATIAPYTLYMKNSDNINALQDNIMKLKKERASYACQKGAFLTTGAIFLYGASRFNTIMCEKACSYGLPCLSGICTSGIGLATKKGITYAGIGLATIVGVGSIISYCKSLYDYHACIKIDTDIQQTLDLARNVPVKKSDQS